MPAPTTTVFVTDDPVLLLVVATEDDDGDWIRGLAVFAERVEVGGNILVRGSFHGILLWGQ